MRAANANELTYWCNILRAAYAHGQTSMVLAVREMGKTLFESSEYLVSGGESTRWRIVALE
ncbi:MAG TPA: hypothetical protein VGO56_13705 [Pyrinomonadaceae bacterium]|nr:hypothetical protein [Pyrinomonadaceae bacterium]